jgi:flagellum-specific peptidoglycan hydrolase FlgJ
MPTLATDIVQAAQKAYKLTGVPASISLAQFALESAWGKKVTGTNNYFGIKAIKGQPYTDVWTHEFLKGKLVREQQPFANYDSPEAAFIAHAKLLSEHAAYATFMAACKAGDIERACICLTGTYATDPHYGHSLWHLIKSDKLLQYDK